jgi:hypothetical protein
MYHSKHENCNTNNNQEENEIFTMMMNPTLVVSSMNSIMTSTSTTPSPFLQIPIPIWVSSSSSSSSTEVIGEVEEEEIVSIQQNEIKEGVKSKLIAPNVQQGQFPNECMCTALRSPNVSNKLNHPNELVPLLPKPTTTSLLHMLETKKNLELVPTVTTTTTTTLPSHRIPTSQVTPQDVLCGRGGVTNSHPGNIAFRRLVQQFRGEYVMAPKHQKMILAKQMVDMIRTEWSGRFLKKVDKDYYQDIGDDQACSKVAQTLREGFAQRMREELRRKATEGPSQSTTASR